MTDINITQLTEEQKKALREQLKEDEKSKKQKKAQDLKALEDLTEESVPKSFDLLKQASQTLTNAKAQIFRNFENYLKLKIETIGIRAKNQQSHTITHGKHSIKLGYRITDGYTDDAGYGLEMVHKFLSKLAVDETSEKLVASLLRLLQRNGKGDLDSKKVLELKQIADRDFPDTDFSKGMEIIQNSYKPKMSKWFIEAWEIDGVGIERNLPLSMTSVELPQDIDLSFLLPYNDN